MIAANTTQALACFWFAAGYAFQLFIAQFKGLLCLMLEPISLAHIKPSFLGNRHSGIKISSALNFLPKTSILFEFCKEG